MKVKITVSIVVISLLILAVFTGCTSFKNEGDVSITNPQVNTNL